MNIRYVENFKGSLDKFDLDTLETSQHVIYAITDSLDFVYFNPEYISFYKENSGKQSLDHKIGDSLLNSISGAELKEYYKSNLEKCSTQQIVWRVEYECSSPELFRQYEQSIHPVNNGKTLIVINRLMVSKPIKEVHLTEFIGKEEDYTDSLGRINQCSNCRCTQRIDNLEKWDWVPSWIKDMPKNVSHTICPTCFDYYWKFRSE